MEMVRVSVEWASGVENELTARETEEEAAEDAAEEVSDEATSEPSPQDRE